MSTNRLMQHWRRTVSAVTCLLRYQLQLVSSELKMVSPRHVGSTEICATCEQEMKACFVSVSVQGTCVEITSDERPHETKLLDKPLAGNCLNTMQLSTYYNACVGHFTVTHVLLFYTYWSDSWSTSRNQRRNDSLGVVSFHCVRSKTYISSVLSMSFGRRKVYWMLDLLYGSPLCSCVRHPWCLVARYLMLQQRIYESRYTMPIRDA